ncbi:hypothetical protein BEH94_11590 [Candidatus Altiarchaeales archaeon WOR_SM1_SCG]|nr:hypothetical protein BEH94_11590 [Candidatus Altiarchaeales archaeon WOR_SM1_SCG]
MKNTKTNNLGEKINQNLFDLWREAMTQLRQLHNDVWNGVRFFLTLNSILIAAIFGLYNLNGDIHKDFFIFIIACIGLLLTIIAINILEKHRNYYLDMLLRKTLLERELGLYSSKISGIDLSFSWNIPEEFIDQIVKNPDEWKNEQRWRCKTISWLLRISYWIFIIIYVCLISGILLSNFCNCVWN